LKPQERTHEAAAPSVGASVKEEGGGDADMEVESTPVSPSKMRRGKGNELPPHEGELDSKLVVKIGAKCTAYDERDAKWYKSSILDIKGKSAQIHYEGWGPKYNVW